MASEYPRQHVWRGNDNLPLTYLIQVYTSYRDGDVYDFLVKCGNIVVAVPIILSELTPIPDDWPDITIHIRPLDEVEVHRVSLKNGEVVQLDSDSLKHLQDRSINGE